MELTYEKAITEATRSLTTYAKYLTDNDKYKDRDYMTGGYQLVSNFLAELFDKNVEDVAKDMKARASFNLENDFK